jgi:periplasmic divalent cation tolerance protein
MEELLMTIVVLVLTTIGEETDAEALARQLVEERLAACASIGPPTISMYRWKGAIERSGERQIVLKTTADRVAALEKRVHELHAYELPEFLVVDVAHGSAGYLSWIAAETARD